MEMSVIFMTTHVGIQLGAGGFNSEASSLVDMLIREFEFEYVSVRCQFISGLLAYVAAQALRVRYSLRRYSDLGFSAMFCLLSGATGMLAYNNAQTITFGGYNGLLQRWIVLSTKFYAERCTTEKAPMAFVTLTTAALALGFGVRAAALSATALFSWEAENNNQPDAIVSHEGD